MSPTSRRTYSAATLAAVAKVGTLRNAAGSTETAKKLAKTAKRLLENNGSKSQLRKVLNDLIDLVPKEKQGDIAGLKGQILGVLD